MRVLWNAGVLLRPDHIGDFFKPHLCHVHIFVLPMLWVFEPWDFWIVGLAIKNINIPPAAITISTTTKESAALVAALWANRSRAISILTTTGESATLVAASGLRLSFVSAAMAKNIKCDLLQAAYPPGQGVILSWNWLLSAYLIGQIPTQVCCKKRCQKAGLAHQFVICGWGGRGTFFDLIRI